MTISTGAFDEYGIPQGSRYRLDDLSDVDTNEATDGDSIVHRRGRWVPSPGGGENEVTIHNDQPTDNTELWLDLDDDSGTGSPAFGVPTGGIIAFGSANPPSGWQLCDGGVVGSEALRAVVGNTVPDLRDRFIVGSGFSYGLGAKGGAATVTLSAAESGMPTHTTNAENQYHQHGTEIGNTLSGTVTAWHTHGGTTQSGGPTHTHDDSTSEGITTGDSNDWIDSADDDTTTTALQTNTVRPGDTAIGHGHNFGTGNPDANHQHWVDPAYTASDSQNAAHTHGVNGLAAQAAHENRPPYWALTYIIKQ